jgi:hypothetical protein
MRAAEFLNEDQTLDEVASLKSIAGWFGNQLKSVFDKNVKARKVGEKEIRNFTNEHMRAFMKLMGRYRADWPTLPMRVIYQYLHTTMLLNDNEIVNIVNNVREESGEKALTLKDIQDVNRKNRVSMNPNNSQIIAEKILADAAIRQLENHWAKQADIETNDTQQDDTSQNNEPMAQQSVNKPIPIANVSADDINIALKQLGAL